MVQPFTDKSIVGQWDPLAKRYLTITGTGQALADAKKLMARTPWKSGFSLDFDTTSGNPTRLAEEGVIASNWHRLGVTVNPTLVDPSVFFGSWDNGSPLQRGTFQAAMYTNGGPPDPDWLKTNLTSSYIDRLQTTHSATNLNQSGVRDPVLDRAFTAAAATLDPAARGRDYATVQRELNQKAYWTMLYFRPDIETNDGRVSNFILDPAYQSDWNIWNWRLAKH